MKRFLFILSLSILAPVTAQTDVNNLFAAGLEDAEQFSTAYLAPMSEGVLYNIGGGWHNTADVKPLGGFEVALIGNLSFFKNKEDKKAFQLNTADYQNLQFVDGSTSKMVSSALGDISGVRVFVEDENGLMRQEFELPSGLASENINFLPSGYLQASVGLIKATEVKVRFLPKINTNDATVGLYGFAIQHELTKHLPADKILPVAISALIGYTHLDGSYDFTDTGFIDGQDQRIEAVFNTWNFQALVSTRLPILNVYGGLGYLTGNSTQDVLGTYDVQAGPFQETYTDPFSIKQDVSGVTANLGFKLKLGFFRLHGAYTMGEFNTAVVGMNFGFR